MLLLKLTSIGIIASVLGWLSLQLIGEVFSLTPEQQRVSQIVLTFAWLIAGGYSYFVWRTTKEKGK